jgi:hypothetical protein
MKKLLETVGENLAQDTIVAESEVAKHLQHADEGTKNHASNLLTVMDHLKSKGFVHQSSKAKSPTTYNSHHLETKYRHPTDPNASAVVKTHKDADGGYSSLLVRMPGEARATRHFIDGNGAHSALAHIAKDK